MRTALAAALGAALALAAAGPALAWGALGHRVAAIIAYDLLTDHTKARVNELLLRGVDPLARADFVSASVWADRDRFLERSSGPWHFASFALTGANSFDTCPVVPSPRQQAAAPVNDCIVSKLSDFADQLTGPQPDARSLRFLIHLVADLHQPLHLADNGDQAGNCVRLRNGPDVADSNLHVFWDVDVVEDLAPPGSSDGDESATARAIAKQIEQSITKEKSEAWLLGAKDAPARGPTGWPALWAHESFDIAVNKVYAPIRPRGCDKVTAPATYASAAHSVATDQLAKSGVRLAFLLNKMFGQ